MFFRLEVLVRNLFFLGLWLGFLGGQTWSLFGVLPSYWSVHVWNWEDAAFLLSVSRYLGVLGEFTSDLEYFAFLSSVGCIGTFWVSVVSGEQDCHQVCHACLGQPPRGVVTLLSLRRFVLMLTLFLSVSQWVNNTTEPNRDANAGEHTREKLLHERI